MQPAMLGFPPFQFAHTKTDKEKINFLLPPYSLLFFNMRSNPQKLIKG